MLESPGLVRGRSPDPGSTVATAVRLPHTLADELEQSGVGRDSRCVDGWWLVGCALLVNACHGSDDDTAGMPGTGGTGSGGSSGTTIGSVTDLDGILAGEGRGYCARLFRCVEGNDDFMNIRALLQTPAACELLLADINQHSSSLRDLRLAVEPRGDADRAREGAGLPG